MKEEIKCPYCNILAEWVENKEIYGKNYGKSYMVWLCRKCGAFVSCHQNTRRPMGTMANRELREYRKEAHRIVDELWKSHKYKRDTVYTRLSEAFGETIHIGESDIERCKEIIKTVPLIFQR